MQLNLVNDEGDVFPLQIGGGATETIDNCKALFEAQYGIPMAEQRWAKDGQELRGNATLQQCNVSESDLIMVVRRAPAPAMPAIPTSGGGGGGVLRPEMLSQMLQQVVQGGSGLAATPRGQIPPGLSLRQIALDQYEPKVIFEYFKGRPDILNELQAANYHLAEAVLTDNEPRFSTMLKAIVDRQKEAKEAERARQSEMNMLQIRLANDPLDIEAQQRVEELIRMENVNENMERAMEHSPESFGSVIMLYVDAVVNNTPVKAFIDTGAQSTIMSQKCAERCGIMRLIDTRFAGIAKGVGTSKILGRVHLAPLKLAGEYFQCTFTILENQDLDFIFGLDMLKRHQCVVDLGAQELIVGPEKKVRLPFLSESEIPKNDFSPNNAENAPGPVASSQGTGGAPAGGDAGGAVTEEKIARLVELGMSRQQATEALTVSNGNEDLAASLLFQ